MRHKTVPKLSHLKLESLVYYKVKQGPFNFISLWNFFSDVVALKINETPLTVSIEACYSSTAVLGET